MGNLAIATMSKVPATGNKHHSRQVKVESSQKAKQQTPTASDLDAVVKWICCLRKNKSSRMDDQRTFGLHATEASENVAFVLGSGDDHRSTQV